MCGSSRALARGLVTLLTVSGRINATVAPGALEGRNASLCSKSGTRHSLRQGLGAELRDAGHVLEKEPVASLEAPPGVTRPTRADLPSPPPLVKPPARLDVDSTYRRESIRTRPGRTKPGSRRARSVQRTARHRCNPRAVCDKPRPLTVP